MTSLWHPDITLDSGPHNVLLKKGEFTDPARDDRIVPYKIYYPDMSANEKAPVIIWSHGFGGNRDGAAFLSRYVASYGYMLVHLTHIGTDSSLWENKKEHPWDVLRRTKVSREITLHRFKDVPFALDQLEHWVKTDQELGPLLDLAQIGMSGHSFGAMTTQAMAGQLIPDETETLIRMKEDRFKAGIAYSPVPIAHLTDAPPADLYGPIDIPLLHMTGTDDASPIEGFSYEHRLVVAEHAAHPEQYVLIKKDGDHMVYNGTKGKLTANPNRERHEDIVKVLSLAFWESKLCGDAAVQDWLRSGAQGWLADDGDLKL